MAKPFATVQASAFASYLGLRAGLWRACELAEMASEDKKRKLVYDEDEGVWRRKKKKNKGKKKKGKKKGMSEWDRKRMQRYWGGEKRDEVLEQIARRTNGLGTVEDAPGGGFMIKRADGMRSMIVGGLHKALQERVYSEGPKILHDDGPSTREAGKMIHRHVCHMIECVTYARPCTCGTRAKTITTLCKGACRVFECLLGKGLMLMASEVLVLAPEWNLATRVDLLCLDDDKRVWLVSIKTGGRNRTETGRTFRGPLSHIRDTQSARHHMQLAAERIALQRTGLNVYKAVTIYVQPNGWGGGIVPLDPWLESAEGCAALDSLLSAGAQRVD